MATAAAAAFAPNRVAAQILTIILSNGTSATATVAAGDSAPEGGRRHQCLVAQHRGVRPGRHRSDAVRPGAGLSTVTFELKGSNGTPVSIGATVSAVTDLSAITTAINAQSANTGIFAVGNGASITLRNEQGEDIQIANFNNTGRHGTIDLTGRDAFSSAAITCMVGAAATLVPAGNDSSTVGGQVKLGSSAAAIPSPPTRRAACSPPPPRTRRPCRRCR
ncbi:hypothetical protein LP420_29385 [Massilia sp. B-10]|nr:hypothetical protein LP420_29385 [Massilia sp. B-10]